MDFEKIPLGGLPPFHLEVIAPTGWISATTTTTSTTTQQPPLRQECRRSKRKRSNNTTTTSMEGSSSSSSKRVKHTMAEEQQISSSNRVSKLLSIPPEILYLIVYSDEFSDHDRLHLRLIHPTINAIVSMKPFLPIIISSDKSGRNVSQELSNLLLSPENENLHGFIKSIRISMNADQSGPVWSSDDLIRNKFPNLKNLHLDVDFSNFEDGEMVENRFKGLGGLLKSLSGVGKVFTVRMRNMHAYASILNSLSGVEKLELEFTRHSDSEELRDLTTNYKQMIAGVITRSSGLKHLSLSSTFQMDVDGILDELPDTHTLNLDSISLDNVKPPRKQTNIEKLSSLSSFSIPVNTSNTYPSDDTHILPPTDGEVDIWNALPAMSDITVAGLSAYYYNNLPSTYNYITSHAPYIRNLTIHFIHPSFPLAESLKKMAQYGQVFWRSVYPTLQNTLTSLKLQADAEAFAVALVRCHTILGDDAAPSVTRMVKRALVNLTPAYPPTSPTLESLEICGMFFGGVGNLSREINRFKACTNLQKLKISLVEDRVVKNDVLLSEGEEISDSLISGVVEGVKAETEVTLFRYSLDGMMKVERDLVCDREGGLFSVKGAMDTMYELVKRGEGVV